MIISIKAQRMTIVLLLLLYLSRCSYGLPATQLAFIYAINVCTHVRVDGVLPLRLFLQRTQLWSSLLQTTYHGCSSMEVVNFPHRLFYLIWNFAALYNTFTSTKSDHKRKNIDILLKPALQCCFMLSRLRIFGLNFSDCCISHQPTTIFCTWDRHSIF